MTATLLAFVRTVIESEVSMFDLFCFISLILAIPFIIFVNMSILSKRQAMSLAGATLLVQALYSELTGNDSVDFTLGILVGTAFGIAFFRYFKDT